MTQTANSEADGATCATDGSCCGGSNKGSTISSSSVTALSPVELLERGTRWKKLLSQLIRYDHAKKNLTLKFNKSELIKAELENLVKMERLCCSHISWQIEESTQFLRLILASDPKSLQAIAKEFLSSAPAK